MKGRGKEGRKGFGPEGSALVRIGCARSERIEPLGGERRGRSNARLRIGRAFLGEGGQVSESRRGDRGRRRIQSKHIGTEVKGALKNRSGR